MRKNRLRRRVCQASLLPPAYPGIQFVDWAAECVVLIPCLNEEANIHVLVKSVRRRLPHVIVVDDGSSDSTAELAADAGAEVLRHSTTRGKGASLAAGWRYAIERGFSWVLMMDGDGQHSPDDIPALLAAAESSSARLVVGNRMANATGMPWLRRMVNQWMSRRLSRAAGQYLPDSQCGFRLADLGVLNSFVCRAEHYEVESEVIMGFVSRGHAAAFVTIQTIYRNSRSKIHPVRDTLRWFRWWRQARAWAEVERLCLRDAPLEKHALGRQPTCKLHPPRPTTGQVT